MMKNNLGFRRFLRVFAVLLVLPSLLMVFDGLIEKTSVKQRI